MSGDRQIDRLIALAYRVASMKPRQGHDGDEESGEHYPDCEACADQSLIAQAADACERDMCSRCGGTGEYGPDVSACCPECGPDAPMAGVS